MHWISQPWICLLFVEVLISSAKQSDYVKGNILQKTHALLKFVKPVHVPYGQTGQLMEELEEFSKIPRFWIGPADFFQFARYFFVDFF